MIFSFLVNQKTGPGTPDGISRQQARRHKRIVDDLISRMAYQGLMPPEMRQQLMDDFFKHAKARKKFELPPPDPAQP